MFLQNLDISFDVLKMHASSTSFSSKTNNVASAPPFAEGDEVFSASPFAGGDAAPLSSDTWETNTTSSSMEDFKNQTPKTQKNQGWSVPPGMTPRANMSDSDE